MSGHVLVGGGTGFIGRHLVKQLTQNGYQVTVASRTGGGGKISWDDIKQNGVPDSVNAIVNLGTIFTTTRAPWTAQVRTELICFCLELAKIMNQLANRF